MVRGLVGTIRLIPEECKLRIEVRGSLAPFSVQRDAETRKRRDSLLAWGGASPGLNVREAPPLHPSSNP